MIRAILFDLYDTLVRPDWELLTAGRTALSERAGVDAALMREQWKASFAGRLRGSHGGLEGDLLKMLQACGQQPTQDVVKDLAAFELESWGRGVQLYPEVVEQLRALRRDGYRLAIVSNASQEAGSVVPILGLDVLMDVVVLSWQIGLAKPDPDIFHLTLEQLRAGPTEALLVDDVADNLDAAERLGMRTAHIIRPGLQRPASRHPRIGSLGELRDVLAPSR